MSMNTNTNNEVYLVSVTNIEYEVDNKELPTELEFQVPASLIDDENVDESIQHSVEEQIGMVTGRCFKSCSIEKKKIDSNDSINKSSDELTIGEANEILSKLSGEHCDAETANNARAKSGWEGVSSYTSKAYGTPESEPAEQGIRDLLTDLQHTCEALDLDFNSLLERATRDYEFFKAHSIE